jgi:O-antigen ligase/tetratricopeptide (TPR) repeat protein
MKESYVGLSQNLIFALVIVATLIATVFFLPTTSEFFEFNKFTAILIIAVIGLVAWSARMILEKRFSFTKTPLDIPIILLIAVTFVATLSSIDQFSSLVGAHSRIWPSFFPLVTLASFYFLTTSNLKSRKQVEVILWTLVIGTAAASIISILSYFGLYLPFDFAQSRAFNTLGLVNRLALLESFVIPITISWMVFSHNKSVRVVATVITLIIAFSLILINYFPSYVTAAVAIIFLILANVKSKVDKSAQGSMAVLAVFIFFFLVLRFVPQVAKGTLGSWIASDTENPSIDIPKELTLEGRTSWDIAAQAIGKRPLFGTGPGTFRFAYTQLKPRYINNRESVWAVRYDKPSSDFTEAITTTGIFGTLAYLVFAVVILRFVWTLVFKSQNNSIYLPVAAGVIGYLVSNFIAITSFANAIPFFLGLSLLAVLAKAADENFVYDVSVELATLRGKFAWFPIGTTNDIIKTSPEGKGAKSQMLPSIFLVLVLVVSAIALRYQINAYRAEQAYRQSVLAARANDGNRTVSFLQDALRANPRIDTYHRVLAQTSLNAALNLSNQQGQLDQNQQRLLLQLAQVAIDQGKVASGYQILPLRLPGISAANVANWETLAAVYQSMIGAINGSDVHAVNTLSQAVALDPQNPVLHDRLGLLYQRINNKDLAQRKFEDSMIVKPDFGPAHYHLAKILIDTQGDVARIVNELNLAKRFLPENDPALPDIDKELENYNQQLRELQAQNQAGSQTPSASPSPSPSVSPSPSPSPSGSPSPSPGL